MQTLAVTLIKLKNHFRATKLLCYRINIVIITSFNLICCLGEIISPAKGTNVSFLPGSTGNLTWTFDDDISTLYERFWYFIPSGGSSELLAHIYDDKDPQVEQSSLSAGVKIVKPATLLLKNVSQSYNGIYRFFLIRSGIKYPAADVRVFIASKYYNL